MEKVKSEFSDTEHIDELSGKTGFFQSLCMEFDGGPTIQCFPKSFDCKAARN